MAININSSLDLTIRKSFDIINSLNKESLSVSLCHIQLERRLVKKLERCRIISLIEFTNSAIEFDSKTPRPPIEFWLYEFWDRLWAGEEHDTAEKVRQLALAALTGRVDWLLFWESIDYNFRFAAAKLDEIINFDDATKALDVENLGIGKTGFLLKRHGVNRFGDLISNLSVGLPDYFGFGKNNIWELACGIRDFLGTINSQGTTSSHVFQADYRFIENSVGCFNDTVNQPRSIISLDSSNESEVVRNMIPDFADSAISNQPHPPSVPITDSNLIIVDYRGPLQYCSLNGSKMSEAVKKLPLSQFHLRKEIKKLNRIGVDNIHQLFELFEKGLPNINGVGQLARFNLYNAVRYADLSITETGDIDWSKFAKLSGANIYPGSGLSANGDEDFSTIIDYRGPLQYCSLNGSKMSEAVKKLPLSQFHLRKEIKKLNRIGVDNIHQLFELFEKGLPAIGTVGQLARKNLFNTVRYADLSITETGNIDWSKFAKLSGFRVIPHPEIPLETGEQFLASLDYVFTEMATDCLDKSEAEILLKRLVSNENKTFTLEQLAEVLNVTRERVRQIQENLLTSISSALLDNEYEGVGFRFSEKFSSYWKSAARQFELKETLSYFEFTNGLSKIWGVSGIQLQPHFRIIYSILTNESSIPENYTIRTIVPFEVFTIERAQDLNRTILFLHPSQALSKICEKFDLQVLDDLLKSLCLFDIPFNPKQLNLICKEFLLPLSQSVTHSGAVSWEKYYEIKGIKLLPECEGETDVEFVGCAIETMKVFIQNTSITVRSEFVFLNRIVPDAENRKTLTETARIIDSFPGQIVREQSHLLRRLYDAVFENDYTSSNVHLKEWFIQKWNNAKNLSQQTTGIRNFAELLGRNWDLSIEETINISPMLLSVIKGRPSGYTGKKDLIISDKNATIGIFNHQDVKENFPVIRLRGFRHVH